MAIDIPAIQKTIEELRTILSRLDHILTIANNKTILTDGELIIELSPEQITMLKNKYTALKSELTIKYNELP